MNPILVKHNLAERQKTFDRVHGVPRPFLIMAAWRYDTLQNNARIVPWVAPIKYRDSVVGYQWSGALQTDYSSINSDKPGKDRPMITNFPPSSSDRAAKELPVGDGGITMDEIGSTPRRGINIGSHSSAAGKTAQNEKGKRRVGNYGAALLPSEYLPVLRRFGQGLPHGERKYGSS